MSAGNLEVGTVSLCSAEEDCVLGLEVLVITSERLEVFIRDYNRSLRSERGIGSEREIAIKENRPQSRVGAITSALPRDCHTKCRRDVGSGDASMGERAIAAEVGEHIE